MTVSSEVSRNDYFASGDPETEYTFEFEIYLKTDLKVYVSGDLQTVDVQYTITGEAPYYGIGNPDGGNVVFDPDYVPEEDAPITLVLDLPLTQLIDYKEGDKFPAETHEKGLDRLVKIAQALKNRLNGVLKVPVWSTLGDIVIPIVANKWLKWNALGTAIEAADIVPEGTDLSEYAKKGWVDVRDYTSINAARTAIGATKTTLLVPNAQTLIDDLDTPSTLTVKILNGGSIVKASTFKANFGGPFEAGYYKVFSGFDAGDITFGVGSVKEVYLELWETNTTPGATDMTIALNSAIQSGIRNIEFLNQIYAYTGITIPASTSALRLNGPSSGTAELRYTPATGDGITFAGEADNLEIHNILLNSPNLSTGRALYYGGLSTEPLRDFLFNQLSVNGFKSGIIVHGGINGRIIGGRQTGQGAAVAAGVGYQVGADAAHAMNHCIIEDVYVACYHTDIYNAFCGVLHLKSPIIGTSTFAIRNNAITFAEGIYFDSNNDTAIWNEGSGYIWYSGNFSSVGNQTITADSHRVFKMKYIPIQVSVYRNGNQTIPTIEYTKIAFNAETEDTEGFFDSTTNYDFTAPHTGYYNIKVHVVWTAGVADKLYILRLKKNSTYIGRSNDTGPSVAGSLTQEISMDSIWLNKGDKITAWVYHNEGIDTTIVGEAETTYMTITE